VTIECIDSVRSLRYQTANTAASSVSETIVIAHMLFGVSPWPSKRSVIWVPTRLITTMLAQ